MLGCVWFCSLLSFSVVCLWLGFRFVLLVCGFGLVGCGIWLWLAEVSCGLVVVVLVLLVVDLMVCCCRVLIGLLFLQLFV